MGPPPCRTTPCRRTTACRLLSLGLLVLTIGTTACTAARHDFSEADPSSTQADPGVPPAPTDPGTPGDREHTERSIDFDGRTRTYRLFVPADLDRSAPAPVVVVMHGGFGSARQAELAYGFDDVAEANGFVVAYPDGWKRAWNAGDCCGEPARTQVDDVGFVRAMMDDIATVVAIDPSRRYATGMSNGAMMAERLACDTDLFAAHASVAGALMEPCPSPHPTSVLHIHGLADSRVPFDGSPGDGVGHVARHTPVEETIAMWQEVDGCDPATTTTDGPVTTSTATCPAGRSVELVTIEDAGHQWPLGEAAASRPVRPGADAPSDAVAATPLIWAFFATHPAPA